MQSTSSASTILEFFHGCPYEEWADIGELAPLLQLLFPSQADCQLIVPEHYVRELESLDSPGALASLYNGGRHFDLMVKTDLPAQDEKPLSPAIAAFHKKLLENSVPENQKAQVARQIKAQKLQRQEAKKREAQHQRSRPQIQTASSRKSDGAVASTEALPGSQSKKDPLLLSNPNPKRVQRTKKGVELRLPTADSHIRKTPEKVIPKSKDISVSAEGSSSEFDLVDTLLFVILLSFVLGSAGVILYALFPSFCLAAAACAISIASTIGTSVYNGSAAACAATSSFVYSCTTSASAAFASQAAVPALIAESPVASSSIVVAAAATITLSPSEKNRP